MTLIIMAILASPVLIVVGALIVDAIRDAMFMAKMESTEEET